MPVFLLVKLLHSRRSGNAAVASRRGSTRRWGGSWVAVKGP